MIPTDNADVTGYDITRKLNDATESLNYPRDQVQPDHKITEALTLVKSNAIYLS